LLLTPVQGLLTTASKTNGAYAYDFATVPLLAELLKLLISSALLQRQKRASPEAARITRSWRTSALFLVPSLIYWLHNNVQFITLRCRLMLHAGCPNPHLPCTLQQTMTLHVHAAV
jgi:UDP-sugar transporter A1/2/3